MLAFTKMQAVGNDFVVLRAQDSLTDAELSELAATSCHRHFGVGADGLLTYAPTDTGLQFRIFNADGSEDTMCGNGLRCAVKLAVERGEAPVSGVAQTRAGTVPYTLLSSGAVTVQLPPPQFWEHGVAEGTTVDTGSVHTVLLTPLLPDDATFFARSPKIETAPVFPEKTSVMWTQMSGANELTLRIWERGVGETLGCGTGACAAAVVALATGRASHAEPVVVHSRGGAVRVEWSGHAEATICLTGEAHTVFSGTL